MALNFKRQAFNAEALDHAQDQMAVGSSKGSPLMEGEAAFINTNNPGPYKLRILPATWKGDGFPFLYVQAYYLKASRTWRVSPATFGHQDESDVPEYRSHLYNEAEKLTGKAQEAAKARAKAFFPARKWFCAVIDRNNEEAGLQFAAFSPKVLENIIELTRSSEFENGVLPFDHPDSGFDLEFTTKKAAGGFPELTGLQFARKESPMLADENVAQGIIDDLVANPLRDRIKRHTEEEINLALAKEIVAYANADEDAEEEADDQPEVNAARGGDADDTRPASEKLNDLAENGGDEPAEEKSAGQKLVDDDEPEAKTAKRAPKPVPPAENKVKRRPGWRKTEGAE